MCVPSRTGGALASAAVSLISASRQYAPVLTIHGTDDEFHQLVMQPETDREKP
jgi:hypothetical protein